MVRGHLGREREILERRRLRDRTWRPAVKQMTATLDIRSRELADAEARLGPIPNGCAIRQPDGSWGACDASRAPIAGLSPFTGPDGGCLPNF